MSLAYVYFYADYEDRAHVIFLFLIPEAIYYALTQCKSVCKSKVDDIVDRPSITHSLNPYFTNVLYIYMYDTLGLKQQTYYRLASVSFTIHQRNR